MATINSEIRSPIVLLVEDARVQIRTVQGLSCHERRSYISTLEITPRLHLLVDALDEDRNWSSS